MAAFRRLLQGQAELPGEAGIEAGEAQPFLLCCDPREIVIDVQGPPSLLQPRLNAPPLGSAIDGAMTEGRRG
jgi:hypothetical protein